MPKFSPVRIQNPTSLQQLVKVNPGQEINLYLDNEIFGEHAVDASTELLIVDSKKHKNGRLYTITHSENIHEWAEYSATMLGEIWIDGLKSIGKVGVLLESKNNEKQVRTVVNPDSIDLRIYPYNVVEVIVYDCRFGYHDEWSCEWQPTKDIDLEEIGYDHLCLHSWDSYFDQMEEPSYLYARLPRCDTKSSMLTRQHHFWFRLNSKAFELITKESGIVHVGNVVINGMSNRYQLQYADKTKYHVALYVDCRKKCYREIQNTLNLKLRNDSSMQHGGLICSQPKALMQVKEVLPEIRDVGIRLIGMGEITGCKTLSTLNESYRPQSIWDEFYDAHTEQVRHHHPQSSWRKWN